MRRDKEYLTISQLAALNQISTDTLRYYDKIGLFLPEYVDEETGYRYYAYSQCERISTILELKKLGIPLEQINAYMEDRNLESSRMLLETVQEKLHETLRQLKKTEKLISRKIKSMEEMKEKTIGRMELVKLPERTVLCMGEYIELYRDGIFQQQRLEALMGRQISAYATNRIGTLIDPDSLLDTKIKVLKRSAMYIIEDEDKKLLKEVKGEYVRKLPEGMYLCVNGRGRFRYSCELAEEIRKYVKQNACGIAGQIVEQDLIDISVTDREEEILYRIEIPIMTQ